MYVHIQYSHYYKDVWWYSKLLAVCVNNIPSWIRPPRYLGSCSFIWTFPFRAAWQNVPSTAYKVLLGIYSRPALVQTARSPHRWFGTVPVSWRCFCRKTAPSWRAYTALLSSPSHDPTVVTVQSSHHVLRRMRKLRRRGVFVIVFVWRQARVRYIAYFFYLRLLPPAPPIIGLYSLSVVDARTAGALWKLSLRQYSTSVANRGRKAGHG